MDQLHHRTRLFCRVIGPYYTIFGLAVLLRRNEMQSLLAEVTSSQAWVAGAMVLLGGIAIVAFHQIWREPAAIIVSLIGWLMLARGITLIGFPAVATTLAERMIDSGWPWWLVYAGVALLGLYLTYVGWRLESPLPEISEKQGKHSARGESRDVAV